MTARRRLLMRLLSAKQYAVRCILGYRVNYNGVISDRSGQLLHEFTVQPNTAYTIHFAQGCQFRAVQAAGTFENVDNVLTGTIVNCVISGTTLYTEWTIETQSNTTYLYVWVQNHAAADFVWVEKK